MPARVNQKQPAQAAPTFNSKSTESSSIKKKGEVISAPSPQLSQEDKVMPKKACSSYILYATIKVKQIVEQEKLSYQEAMKKAGALWGQLNDKGKEPYVNLQAKDQLRYEKEMEQFNKTGFFTNKDGVCSSTLKAKPKRVKRGEAREVVQEVKPKKAMSGFMFMMKDQAAQIMKENGLKNCCEAAPIVSQRWKEYSDSQKQKYVDMAVQDQARQQKQIKELEVKGYFTLEDGTLSSSIKPKVKKILGKRTQGAQNAAAQEQNEAEGDSQGEQESSEEAEVVVAPKKRARKN